MNKIGIFGGSFDPIHLGHLLLAEQVRVETGLTQVIFVPANVSPFKQNTKSADAETRLAMVRLATESNPYFRVSDVEIRKKGVSYTAETLRQFREEFGEETEICFITGTDAFMSIGSWKEAEYLLSGFSFAIGLRPGFEEESFDRLAGDLRREFGTTVLKVYSPKVDISSSHIRELIDCGKSARYLLPDCVLNYVESKGLYRSGGIRQRIEAYIEGHLKPSRLLHTRGVVLEAAKLADRYGADGEKAQLCALFHDACREAGNLEHGVLAAQLMIQDYGIEDPDMINAVRYHTTGREGMSLLEKILYLADAIEPSRSYPGVEELRRAAYENLDGACLLAMERSVRYVQDRDLTLDVNTVKALEYIKKGME